MFRRKLIAASITSVLYPLTLNPHFIELEFLGLVMMYSLPVIYIYGIATSLVSDWLASLLAKKKNKIVIFLTFLFHTIFGLVLLHISLIAAWLFFVIDRLLKRKQENYQTKTALLSFLLPICFFIFFLVLIMMNERGG
ncbi:hypothetical protein P4U90_11840 [Cytobacillus kochii]|uniref:hypothetical protein n=1 Tax=Cytobacillus TaxID=2675230 RepID=UPI0027831315|nr:hypothetical protein [Cytobacillus kochii]MDQ0185327.1 hypothetical protein [Cytobacillus kochii]MED1606019.1 hypothetical protein [Cytobacillus kochii]